MQESNDNVLLRRYVEGNSEEAFSTLVARHVDRVYSVAMRHTNNRHQAEEITQAVFVIFARKARNLVSHAFLSGWLLQTARLASVTFVRREIRRARREQEAQMQTFLNQNEPESWGQIAPLLDAALAALKESDRNAIILRFFDGKNLKEVGDTLSVNEEAAKKRVSRALNRLRVFFARRGVSSTASVIAGVLSANSVQSAPTGLANSICATALLHGVTADGSKLTLVKGTLKIMAWSKVKTAVVAGVVILTIAGTATVALKYSRRSATNPTDGINKQFETKPGRTVTVNAANFLAHLKSRGLLPGFPTNENAKAFIMIENLYQDTNGTWKFSQSDTDAYPATRTLHASKNNDGQFVYYYTVVRESETANWHLVKAWRTDKNGKLAQEYAIP